MTRLYNPPHAIDVKVADDKETPLSFQWNGEQHPIEVYCNRWVVDTDWWTNRQARDHFKLLTTTGWLVIIYHNLGDGKWYLQRVYD
jgi:hypothetical protein